MRLLNLATMIRMHQVTTKRHKRLPAYVSLTSNLSKSVMSKLHWHGRSWPWQVAHLCDTVYNSHKWLDSCSDHSLCMQFIQSQNDIKHMYWNLHWSFPIVVWVWKFIPDIIVVVVRHICINNAVKYERVCQTGVWSSIICIAYLGMQIDIWLPRIKFHHTLSKDYSNYY